ncbi:hypothetical protein [Tenacibaculum aiptasiae]|uniref:hypothetical protein n=1 Tax=Tenacibaculum aiptasiae TaxID=426481 RepID=UPI003B5A514E
MKQVLIIILIFGSLNLFGQKSDIENLINQIVKDEVPENFKYFFLVSKSIEQQKIHEIRLNHEIRKLKLANKNFPNDFIYTQAEKDTINWEDYNLNKVKYVSSKKNYIRYLSPPQTKKIRFVKYRIDQKKFDSLINNKEPYTLIVKKKWLWNKKRIWHNKKFYDNFVKSWNMDDKNNPEETVYFHFSKPMFSNNKKYALISIIKMRRCDGIKFTSLYKNNNGVWKKIKEFKLANFNTFTTHIECKDIKRVNYE